MRSAFFLVFLLGVFGRCLCEGKAGFRGDRVVRATPANEDQLKVLSSLEENDLNLDFWTHPSHVGASVDIHVTAAEYPKLAKLLQANGIVFTIQIPDVQSLLDNENPPSRSVRAGFAYDRYNRLSAIEQELKSLVKRYHKLAKLLVTEFGRSHEGRTIHAIKISSNPGAGKKVFFFNCGIHAREWITPATCMNIINQMLSKYGKDASVTAMVDKLDWVIMPVFNVDGYEFTHTGSRMWRKTRKPSGSGCIGTDPNRNWNFHWAEPGASGNPCSDTYYGSRPFSEVEVRNVARYLYRNRKNLIGYMDIHAYSQFWMIPWGYKKAWPNDNGEMKRVSEIAVDALYKAGYRTRYKNPGPSSIVIYANSGSTKDWAYGVLGVKYAFALELRDTGRYGFALPANQIMPTGLETFAAIKAMAKELKL